MKTFNEYQDWTVKTAQYPKVGTGDNAAITYTTLGLVGEAGEVAEKVKKILRGDKMAGAKTCSLCRKVSDDLSWIIKQPAGVILVSDDLSWIIKQPAGVILGGESHHLACIDCSADNKQFFYATSPFVKNELILKELGDVLYYLARLAKETGFTLEEVAAANVEKLTERMKKGTIKGSGDTR